MNRVMNRPTPGELELTYAQEEGPDIGDLYIHLGVIEDTNLLWINHYRDTQTLCFVDLEQYTLFGHLEHGLPNYVGVIGFLSLNKYNLDYHSISLHRRNRPRENVNFFINRQNTGNLENIVYSYTKIDERLAADIDFVFTTSNMPMFQGETIRNEKGRRVTLLNPIDLGGYIDYQFFLIKSRF